MKKILKSFKYVEKIFIESKCYGWNNVEVKMKWYQLRISNPLKWYVKKILTQNFFQFVKKNPLFYLIERLRD